MRNTRDTKLLFELSEAGRRAHRLPACDVPERPVSELLPASSLAAAPPALPELPEPEVVRHFANLSQLNMSVDTHFYPLGSCTMKYNPKRNERIAAMPGFADVHPYQPESTLQGMLQVLYELQEYLKEISGLAACSLQPAAGAHGELTALWVAAAYFRDVSLKNGGEKRTKVLVPDSAHGTNPASATMAGFETVTVKTLPTGTLDMDDLRRHLDDQIAVFMITNPNTVGIFEPKMREIADMVHQAGGLVYLDGANMNAILGITRPGDFGADMQHYNPHKTFSGPHGGGGPAQAQFASRRSWPHICRRRWWSKSRDKRQETRARSLIRLLLRRSTLDPQLSILTPSTTTAPNQSVAFVPSSATSACWSALTVTFARTAPMASAA